MYILSTKKAEPIHSYLLQWAGVRHLKDICQYYELIHFYAIFITWRLQQYDKQIWILDLFSK